MNGKVTILFGLFGLFLFLIEPAAAQKNRKPLSADVYFARGLAEKKTGDCDAAIENFEKAIGLNARDARFYRERGDCLNKSYNLAALTDFDKAIEIKPDYAEAFAGRGFFYFQQELLRFAVDDIEKGLEYHDKAIADFDKAIALDPRCSECYFIRADYWSAQDDEQALADINKAIELNPRNRDYLKRRAQIYEKIGEFQMAISGYDAIIKLYPRDYDAFYLRGRIYSSLGEYQKAVDDFSKALEIEPKLSSLFLTVRAEAYRAMGKISEAEADEKKLNTQYQD